MGKFFKYLSVSIVSVMCAVSLGCAVGKASISAATSGTNPSATPVIGQIAPQSLPAGAPTQSIKILGTNFSDQAVILWNGARLTTSTIDSSTLSGTVDSSVLASATVAQLQVVNSTGQQSAAVPFTITAAAAANTATLKITTGSANAAAFGVAYSQALQATGGTPNYTWSITSGSLPAGLSLVPSTGMIAGTPTVSGTFPVVVAVTDSSSPAQTQSTSLAIAVSPSDLAVASSTMSAGSVGVAYSQPLQVTGGTPNYTWAVTAGSLPAGLSLAPSAGVITGTPSAAGTFPFTLTVADSSSPAQSKSITASITVSASSLSVVTGSLGAGVTGSSYSQTLQAAGGTPAYTWTITSGTLPTSLSITRSGVIAGTPTVAGTFPVTATVTDSGSPAQSKSASYTVVVAPSSQLTITSSTLATATSGTPYSQSLQAGGGTAPYAWSVASGSLPGGLTLASSTGVISGTPTTAGSSIFTVKVTDGGSPAQTKSVSTSITVAASTLSITSSSLAAGTSSTAYSQTLSASGGTTPYAWSIASGTLPAGLTLTPSTGVISGTPTTIGSSTFTVKVTDGGSPAQTKSVSTSITVTASPLSISSSSLASGTNGTAYAQSLSATGGTPAYTWNYSGTLPAGLTLAATTGVISGTPTTTGTFSFTVRVTDNSTPSQSQSASTSITVAAAAAAPTGPGTSWYVRADGGTRYSANTTTGQCDGKADAAYGGVGTNQHCAFNDYRFLYDDQSYGNRAWVIAGGDTVILRGGPWRVGF
ncbi:MAG: Ig domain protein, partial [Acidobacteriaceae bacterium]|nr:Ig domain protein [Acidobacteriaceae bacterium]